MPSLAARSHGRQIADRRHPAAPRDEGCEHEVRLRGEPAAIAVALREADTGVRASAMRQLQRQVGNGGVQQLAEAASGPTVQRWNVGVAPGTTDCMVVVNWLNRNSPYRTTSGWAKTSATHWWDGSLVFAGEGDSLTVSVRDPVVSLTKSVDMPAWAPTNPAMRSAWAAMTADLRAHEAQHEAIAVQWKATMVERLKTLTLSVPSRGKAQAAVQAEFDGWVREHQADQKAIDPFTATLDCSAAAETPADSATPEATVASGADDGAD